jgi:hypothetical protein
MVGIKLPTSALPLQRIETIDEPRDREKAAQAIKWKRLRIRSTIVYRFGKDVLAASYGQLGTSQESGGEGIARNNYSLKTSGK